MTAGTFLQRLRKVESLNATHAESKRRQRKGTPARASAADLAYGRADGRGRKVPAWAKPQQRPKAVATGAAAVSAGAGAAGDAAVRRYEAAAKAAGPYVPPLNASNSSADVVIDVPLQEALQKQSVGSLSLEVASLRAQLANALARAATAERMASLPGDDAQRRAPGAPR